MLGIKIPKGEKVWVSYLTSDKRLKYIITSKLSKDYYYLYEISDSGEIKKLGRAKSPNDLESTFQVKQKIVANPV